MKRLPQIAHKFSGALRLSAFLMGIAFLAAGCGGPAKEPEPLVAVQVTLARRSPISEIVTAEAVVFPLQQAVISPKITSTIKQFLVQRGSRVHKGQLLAVLESADLSAAAEQSKGDYQQAQAGFVTTVDASLPEQIQKAQLDAASAKTNFDAQQKVFDSRKELFSQGAIPRRDLDSAGVALSQARSQSDQAQKQLDDLNRTGHAQALKSAEGQLSSAKGKFLGAEAQLSYSQIRSPVDGVVTDRPLYPGEIAAANQPLLTVMDTSRLIAKSHIAQSAAASLKVGDVARIVLSGNSSGEPIPEPILGRVSLVSPALDPGSTTIEVWVEIPKPSDQLEPGMTVELSITARTASDAIVVPTAAVFTEADSGDYVMVAGSDGLAHVTPVHTGLRGPDEIQILSGIKQGEAVITSGGYALPDKTRVKIETAAPASDSAGADKE
ncbi:MAG: efflux RND transporter periplasmic adaptor subunit [Candidatus Acidiferrales bacterium]